MTPSLSKIPKRFATFLFYLSLVSCCFSQSPADSAYYNHLYFLCKVWGHAKYFHPEIAKGNVDWDTELINTLEVLRQVDSEEGFNTLIFSMLGKAGPVPIRISSRPVVPDSLNNNLDLAWMKDPIFSLQVQAKLDSIYNQFGVRRNAYVGEAWLGGPPDFGDDIKFVDEVENPGEPLRLLALFRYWNIIHYFFPYKYIMDQHWDSTLVQFIPSIAKATQTHDYHLAFKEMTTYINDSHAFFNSPPYWRWDGRFRPPFEIRYIENATVITKVLEGVSEVQVGDVIEAIDGRDIHDLRESLRRYSHASNEVIIQRNINDMLVRGNEGNFSLTIDRGQGSQSLSLSREADNFALLQADTSPIWREELTPNGLRVGIVDMGRLEVNQIRNLFQNFSDTDAIVFDIRNYPNGTLWTLVDYLYPRPINIANFTTPDITFPGRLFWAPERIGQGTSTPYPGKIAILFDERTQSQAEYTVMGLEQFPGAIKVGSTTAAADGNVAAIRLPGNITTWATFLGTYYPDYTPTQRIGIIPDIEVLPTIEGIRAGRDEVMEMAFAALDGTLTNSEEDLGGDQVHVYPNPVYDRLFFSLTDAHFLSPFQVSLYNVVGQGILRKERWEIGEGMDVSTLKAGVYLIALENRDGRIVKRFVKN